MNILITGANGFIGSNLMTLLSDIPDVKLFGGTRKTIDLYSDTSVREFFDTNEINGVIHCAIEGGRRGVEDTQNIVYNNLMMFHNLINRRFIDLFINIASGAEYDRSKNMGKAFEGRLWSEVPVDYYGFSKNLISRSTYDLLTGVSLRLFGCFYHNESPERMIRKNIERYIRGEPIIIHQDRFMDFFYMEDLATVIKYYITTNPGIKRKIYKDVNMSYEHTPRLSELARIINNLSDKKVEIIIEDPSHCNAYSGYGKVLKSLNLPLKGLQKGIEECYARLK